MGSGVPLVVLNHAGGKGLYRSKLSLTSIKTPEYAYLVCVCPSGNSTLVVSAPLVFVQTR